MADIQRARLSPATGANKEEIFGPNEPANLLQPLYQTTGVLFPYTPNVFITRTASYEDFHFTHSNYKFYQFQNSAPGEIQVTGDFTVQTNEEGRYLLAVLQFLKSMTMIEYGLDTPSKRRGTPPPALRFNYLGPHMFSNVPVVVTSVTYDLQKDVDYVPVQLPPEISQSTVEKLNEDGSGKFTTDQFSTVYLPTKVFISLQLLVQQNPRDLRDNFNLSKFKSGELLNKGYL